MIDTKTITNIIKILEEQKANLHNSIPVYSDVENGKFSNKWLAEVWQYNREISNLQELEYDTKFNKHLVTPSRIDYFRKRLKERFGLTINL